MSDTVIDEQGRPKPPLAGDEVATLRGFLDFQRATLRWKTDGVDAHGLRVTTAKSGITLGALLKHLAFVEDYWFGHVLHGRAPSQPWVDQDWDADPDWDWTSAVWDTPRALRAMWAEAVARADGELDQALATGGLDQLPAGTPSGGAGASLRWILVHMIEEYARHNGHADLLREVIDGETGE